MHELNSRWNYAQLIKLTPVTCSGRENSESPIWEISVGLRVCLHCFVKQAPGSRHRSQVTVWPQQQTGSQGWPSWREKLEVLTQSSFHSWGNVLRVFTNPALWNRPEVVQVLVLVLVLVLVCPCCTLWWRAIRISFFRETSNSIYLNWKPGPWCAVWGARCVTAPSGSLKKAVFSIWYMFRNDTS